MEYWLGILVCAIGGLVLVWAFVRPRKGDEPHCRKCRFCLAGLTDPARCPECGRDLSRPRSKVKGQRPSPRRAIFWCFGLALIGGSLIGLDHMNRSGFFPLTKYKPAFVLQAEAYVLGDLRASIATDELVDRIDGGTLGKNAEERLVKTALARHAQTWRVFPDEQWMVITHAMGRNELSFEQIERLWDDAFTEAKLVAIGKGDGRYYPGESLTVSAGVHTRAGKLIPSGIGNIGFGIDPMIRICFENEQGEMKQAATMRSRGPIVQRYSGPVPNRSMAEEVQIRLDAPEQLGMHRGIVELEFDFAEELVATTWPGITSDQLDKLATLKHSYRFPFTIKVVEPEELDLPVVDPAALAIDSAFPIHFEVVRIYSAVESGSVPGIMYRIGTTVTLDPAIGLGGYVVFEQGEIITRSVAPYGKHHATAQAYMPLNEFMQGAVRVRYEHDHGVARNNRDIMTRVLGGPIDLGTFTIPEPETDE